VIAMKTRKNRAIPDEKVKEIVSLWYQGLGERIIAELVGVNYCQVRGICSGQFYTDVAGQLDKSKRKKPCPNANRVIAERIRQEQASRRAAVVDPNRDPKVDPIPGDVLGNVSLECKVISISQDSIRYEARGMFNCGKFDSLMDLNEWRSWATNPTYFVEVRKRGDQ
jgi:hypothetical protein